MHPVPVDDPNFEGHPQRRCGEHRTVGPHRAWCHDCSEWCYPDDPCERCRPEAEPGPLPTRAEVLRVANAAVAAAYVAARPGDLLSAAVDALHDKGMLAWREES